MTEKEKLEAKAKDMGIELDSSETIADLKAKIAAKEAEPKPEPELQRRRLNRGSTRRITNALSKFDKAAEEFTKEMDLQFFEADADGNRTGEWDFVKALREMRTGVMAEVNKQLYPEAEASGDE